MNEVERQKKNKYRKKKVNIVNKEREREKKAESRREFWERKNCRKETRHEERSGISTDVDCIVNEFIFLLFLFSDLRLAGRLIFSQ
jgi:hypothetical protein